MTRNKNDKSGTTSSKKGGIGGRLGKLSNWERFGGILAILLFLFSLYLLISFISFFISGGADISHLDVSTKELLSNPDLRIQNAGGRWGAVLANLFINKGFGIASIGIIYLFVIISLRLGREFSARAKDDRVAGYFPFFGIRCLSQNCCPPGSVHPGKGVCLFFRAISMINRG